MHQKYLKKLVRHFEEMGIHLHTYDIENMVMEKITPELEQITKDELEYGKEFVLEWDIDDYTVRIFGSISEDIAQVGKFLVNYDELVFYKGDEVVKRFEIDYVE
jgi:hypothetical protein